MKSKLFLLIDPRAIKCKWNEIIAPPNLAGDENRQRIVLDTLLSFSIIAFIIINIIRIIDRIIYVERRGFPLWVTILILAFLFWIASLSWRKKIKLASILLIALYSLPMILCLTIWGADLPAGLLLSVLIIIMSVALFGSQSAFMATFIVSAFLATLTELQNRKIINVQNYWRQENNGIGDVIVYAALLLVITSVIWLFARGIRQSLARAQESEKNLKEERDSLEIKVKERTAELRRAEQEKINQLYRLAEFGKLSSGIFHDLMNPLTAVSLNLGQIKGEADNGTLTDKEISRTKTYLSQAMLASHKMENLIAGLKKQIQKEDGKTTFVLNEEIREIIQILSYKARKANVQIGFTGSEDLIFTGDAIKFGQIIINILANAIDASEDSEEAQNIEITLKERREKIIITIEDQGAGIAPENIDRIFEPFFSTKKKTGQGLGIGLSLTKEITEKTFGGTIDVVSQLGVGSLFTVSLPLNFISNEK